MDSDTLSDPGLATLFSLDMLYVLSCFTIHVLPFIYGDSETHLGRVFISEVSGLITHSYFDIYERN